MIDLSSILDAYAAARRAGEVGWLATLVEVEGSTYMRPGARAFITPRGGVVGLVSGGCLEKDLAEHARALSVDAPRRLVVYDLRDEDDIDFGLGLGCKGKLTIVIEPIDPHDPANPLERLRAFWNQRPPSPGVVVTALDEARPATALERECTEVLRAGKSRIVALDGKRYFVEYLAPRMSLAIFGAGPDAVPVVHRAKALGWWVALWDHRESALANDGFSTCDERHLVPVAGLARAAAEARTTAALVMTHHYRADAEILRGLAGRQLPYVGLLGPRDRARALFEELAEPVLENLHSPAGLDVGAGTPEAIALSIIAEIHAVLHGRSGGSLRHRGGPIHDRDA
ncbi:XdhC family protein [Pendulispora rubella]|uniref:XdhC family protein n=1 Tax=Pendulispora rubella TaxID=2741070 RepID=A0ABZ2L166_9BACT